MHTVHTIMSGLAKLRVHIAPVGFEIDRIVIPAKKMKADKVWLIRHSNRSEDKATKYLEKIQKDLKKEKIQVEFAEADRNDIFDILKNCKRNISKRTTKRSLCECFIRF